MIGRILKADESENRGAECLATVKVSLDELERKVGFPPFHFVTDGLGDATGFVCKVDQNLVFSMLNYDGRPRDEWLVYSGAKDCLSQILGVLVLDESVVTWSLEDVRKMNWQVIRQDEHGTQFVMSEFETKEEAEVFQSDWSNIGGHKRILLVIPKSRAGS